MEVKILNQFQSISIIALHCIELDPDAYETKTSFRSSSIQIELLQFGWVFKEKLPQQVANFFRIML